MTNDQNIRVTKITTANTSSYDILPDTAELRCVLDAIASWGRLPELVSFALERRGYGESDGGFGVTYPSDLDDYDRVACGYVIPQGSVEVYGFFGPPDGYQYQVPEVTYLEVLAKVLEANRLLDEARTIIEFRAKLSG